MARSLLLVSFLAAVAPGRAAAQRVRLDPFIGAGFGVEQITSGSFTHVSPSIQLREGLDFGRGVAGMIELGTHGVDQGTGADSVDAGIAGPRVFTTLTLLAGLQVQVTRGLYLRPAAGLARHVYRRTETHGDGASVANPSEIATAAQLTIGHRLAGSWLPVGVEAFGLYSTGERSGVRWATGLQLTADVHF